MRLTCLFNFLTHILDTFCVPSIVQVAHIIPIQICTGITADFAMIFFILGRKWDLLQNWNTKKLQTSHEKFPIIKSCRQIDHTDVGHLQNDTILVHFWAIHLTSLNIFIFNSRSLTGNGTLRTTFSFILRFWTNLNSELTLKMTSLLNLSVFHYIFHFIHHNLFPMCVLLLNLWWISSPSLVCYSTKPHQTINILVVTDAYLGRLRPDSK